MENTSLLNLEQFVLSSNRRKLLQLKTNQNDTKDDDNVAINTTILHGSNEHIYYHLLQIENELTSILVNNNDLSTASKYDIDKIKSLLNEANDIIMTYNKKQGNKSNDDVDIMAFRHRLRKLFLLPHIKIEENKEQIEEEEDIYDILIHKLGVKFNYSKPNDIVMNDNNDNKENKIKSIMEEFNLKKEFDALFAQCNTEGDITRYFTADCLHLLLDQNYKDKSHLIADLFAYSNKQILGASNNIDILVLFMKHWLTVESISDKQWIFTVGQMEQLGEQLPKLWQNDTFILKYLEKLLPVEVEWYMNNKTFNPQQSFVNIPMNLQKQCYEIAVKFVLLNENCHMSAIKKANILVNYLQFKRINENMYDFEVFMEYLNISKKTFYNTEIRNSIIDNKQESEPWKSEFQQYEDEIVLLNWIMNYNKNIDSNVINEYLRFYVGINWQEYMTEITLRFKSKWLITCIDENKGKEIEEYLMNFVDKRFLMILKLEHLLLVCDDNKQCVQYINELKDLIENASKPKP
eukprot:197145_1